MEVLTGTGAREVRDVYGRTYRIGESAHDLTGHSRRSQVWAGWACMVAISPLQYSFGVAVLGMQSAQRWGIVETMWLLALFVTCQALAAIPVARLHRSRLVSSSQLVVLGGVLSAAGMATIAHAGGVMTAVLGYSVVGGVGAGLVYSACITTTAKWFPDNRVATIGFVTGGFACGAVTSIVLLSLFSSQRGHAVVFDVAAVVALVTVT
ncbi:MAG: MFS transporter, partial [Thermocrispum sp.]